jgi:hypothetical protein
MFAAGTGQALNDAHVDRFDDEDENDRRCSGDLLQGLHTGAADTENHVGRQAQKLRAETLSRLETCNVPPRIDRKVAADRPSQFFQLLSQCRYTGLCDRIVGVPYFHHADARYAVRLLREGAVRPRQSDSGCRACKPRDEFAPPHLPLMPKARAYHIDGVAVTKDRGLPPQMQRLSTLIWQSLDFGLLAGAASRLTATSGSLSLRPLGGFGS